MALAESNVGCPFQCLIMAFTMGLIYSNVSDASEHVWEVSGGCISAAIFLRIHPGEGVGRASV